MEQVMNDEYLIQPADQIFSICQSGDPMVTIRADKTMEFGPNYTPDAAAKIFWDAVLAHYPQGFAANTAA
jgi:hypothetical protein